MTAPHCPYAAQRDGDGVGVVYPHRYHGKRSDGTGMRYTVRKASSVTRFWLGTLLPGLS